MSEEVLREEGVVTEIKNGQIKIELMITSDCDTCTTKEICKSGKMKYLILKNDNNYKIGDLVVIEVLGRDVLKTVVLLYGIPTILVLVTLFATYFGIESSDGLYSILIPFISIGIYYFFLSHYLKKTSNLNRLKIYKKN